MPTLLYLTYPPCENPPAASATGRVVQEVVDLNGTGTIYWTANGGVLPADVFRNFEVYEQGKQLTYLSEYTVTPMSAPNQSTITILFPKTGIDMYYRMVGYY